MSDARLGSLQEDTVLVRAEVEWLGYEDAKAILRTEPDTHWIDCYREVDIVDHRFDGFRIALELLQSGWDNLEGIRFSTDKDVEVNGAEILGALARL